MAPCASKFENPIYTPCSAIAHPWCPDSCLKGVLMMVVSSTLGSAPFLFLFTLARIIMKHATSQTQTQQDDIRQFLVRILRMTLFGTGLASGLVASMCLLRNGLGRFHNCTVGFLPGCVGGLTIFTQKKSDIRPIIDTFYLVVVEYGLRKVSSSLSVTSQTVGFSVVSALLSLLQYNAPFKSHIPWFHWLERRHESISATQDELPPPMTKLRSLQPLQRLARLHHGACEHEGGCLAYAAKGSTKYLAVGVALSLTQGVLPRLQALYASKSQDLRRMPSLLRWNLPAFLSAYVALFRVSRCLLCWVYNKDCALHSALAGSLAGVSYLVHPSLSVFAAALASASEVVEYGLRKVSSSLSVTSQTVGFSVVSALLSLLQYNAPFKSHIPWFHWLERRHESISATQDELPPPMTKLRSLQPLQRLARLHHGACEHEGGCLAYAAKGSTKYLAVGVALSLTQGVLPRLQALYASKSQDLRRMPSLLRWNLPAFLSAYVALFRVSRCLLCWVYNKDCALHSALAGSLAGVSYLVHPSLSVFAAALASASELLWNCIAKSGHLPKILHSCPRLVVVILTGLMVHARIFDRDICPRVGTLILSQCSRGRADEMLNAHFKIFLENGTP